MKTRAKKRIFAILLAGFVVASIVGCTPSGGDGGTESASGGGGGNNNGTAADNGAVTEYVKPEYSEIKVEVFDRGNQGGSDPTDNFYTDWIKAKVLEDLNIGVSFVKVGRWTEDVDMVNLLTSGIAPDLCYSYNDNKMIETFSAQGGITNLTPYLEQMQGELTDMTEFLGDFLVWRNQDPGSGDLYSIMGRRMEVARTCAYIRKDWLDALGLPLPKTTDEFVDALRAFKENDPGNVGKDRIIPLTLTPDVRWRASTLIESFIPPNLTEKEIFTYSVTSQVNVLFPGIKEGVRLLNQMYNEGLIDRDFALYPDDTVSDNLIKSGLVGASIHSWDQPLRDVPGQIPELVKNVPGAEFVPVDCFTNPANGLTTKLSLDTAGVFIFIPKQSKNPEGALRYLNWLCKLENRLYLQIGDEGETHEIVDGVPIVIPVEGPKIMNSPNNIDYTIPINGLDLGDDKLTGISKASAYPSVDPELVGMALEVSLANTWRLPHIPIEGGLPLENSIGETLKDKQKNLFCTAISTSTDKFDSVWDAGMADYLASGAQEAMDDRAAKYPK